MESVTEMAELVILGNMIDQVQLTDEEDVMTWKWTNDGL